MKTKLLIKSISLLVLILVGSLSVNAQCPSPSNNFKNFAQYDMTPSSIGDTNTNSSTWGGDYHNIQVVTGKTYVISTCKTNYAPVANTSGWHMHPDTIGYDPFITLIHDTANANSAVGNIVGWDDNGCGNGSLMPKITYTSTFTGDLAVVFDSVGKCDKFVVDSLTVFVTEIANGPSATITAQTNISCNGLTDGGATASASGSTTPYTYAWSNAATTASINGVAAGTYTVTVTDANGNTTTTSTTITQPATVISSAAVTTTIACNSGTQGQVTASSTGGTTPYTFSWNTGGTAALETGLGTGTYSVTITDQNGCTDSSSVVLSEPVTLVSSALVTSSLNCNGNTDGQVTASSTGGSTPYTFSWNTGGTSALETGLGSGTYSVTITDQNGCTDSTSVLLSEPVVLNSSASVTSSIDCYGGTQGQVTASSTGGTTPYTFSWNTGGTAALETGLGASTYSVTITDQNGCTDSTSVLLSEPVVLNSSASVTSIIDCNGGTQGQVTASSTGGTTPYTFSWNTGGTAALETGLGASTYSVTITDQNGCTDSTSVIMTEPANLVAATVVDSNSIDGNPTGGATGSATGGTMAYTYSWSNGATTASITGNSAGTYSITITDQNGCTGSSSAIILNVPSLNASIAIDSNVSCNAGSNGGLTATANGSNSPFTFAWSNGATTASITGVAAGTYTVTVTDAGSNTASQLATITEPAALVAASVVDSNTTCNGVSDGGATASATGGTMPYTYAWSNSATTASITGVMAGTYSTTITDANGCTSTSSATVTQPAILVAASVIDSNTTCNGVSDGGATASAAGGTMPYTYAWSNSATTVSITGVMAGTYTTTITDANGCTSTSSATVTEPALLVAASVIDSNISCNSLSDGGATASATGGTMPYTYAWSNSATTASITGVVAGTYTVTIMDANACSSTSSATVTEPTVLMAASVVDSNISCNSLSDGGASASATGGTAPYTYSWSNSATTASITGVIAGTYSVTILDNNGCSSTSSATITEPAALVAATVIDSNVVCFGQANGGASASATGGTMPYAYLWSNAATTASITGVVADSFAVVITDANGCTATSSSIITEPALMVLNIGNDTVVCLNQTVVIDAGAGFTTYSWSDNTTMQTTTANTSVYGSTDYSVTVTNINGCEAIDTLNVSVNNLSSVTITPISDLCAYAMDTLKATTGFNSYLWSTTDTTNNLIVDANNLSQGNYTYSIIATDSNGCIAYDTTTVGVFNEVAIDLGPDVTVQWIDGVVESYTLDAGTGYSSYSWNNGNSTNQTYMVTLLNMGNVYLDVTDGTGCTGKDTIFVDFILSTPAIEIGQVKMYPNPAYDVLNIEISNFVGQDELDIKIMSITGAVVLNQTYQVNGSSVKQTIDVSSFKTGTYFVEFNSNGQKTMKSFIVR